VTAGRFVILEHDHPFRHWDLLLEAGDVALTWRLLRPPLPDEPIAAERLPDHRLMYLDYEGPVSGDRGTVNRVASGTFDSTGSHVPDADGFSVSISGESGFRQICCQRTPEGRLFFLFR
jgi:hypothetical protein